MKMVALIGLVSIEKIELTVELASYYTWQTDQTVTVIDNVARLAIDPTQLSDERLIRLDGDINASLMDTIQAVDTDFVLLAVSESAELDRLFVSLDILTETLPDIDLTTVGLIDLRTCDCFPNVRETLEDYADVHFLAPFSAEMVIGAIEGTIG